MYFFQMCTQFYIDNNQTGIPIKHIDSIHIQKIYKCTYFILNYMYQV